MFLYLSLAILLSSSSYNDAFTINSRLPSITKNNNVAKTVSILSMSSEEGTSTKEDKSPIIKGGKKEIMYDEKTGRFFETEEECDPETEYCVIDQKTGKSIQLTIEEKERIFLDSLQSYYINGKQMISDASKSHKSASNSHKSASKSHNSVTKSNKLASNPYASASKSHKSASKSHKSVYNSHKSDSKSHKSVSKSSKLQKSAKTVSKSSKSVVSSHSKKSSSKNKSVSHASNKSSHKSASKSHESSSKSASKSSSSTKSMFQRIKSRSSKSSSSAKSVNFDLDEHVYTLVYSGMTKKDSGNN